MDVLSDVPSATYAYYQSSIKPKPGKPAGSKTVWRCTVCGYVYEGEELPADFTCPLCKHPASDFEKVTGLPQAGPAAGCLLAFERTNPCPGKNGAGILCFFL